MFYPFQTKDGYKKLTKSTLEFGNESPFRVEYEFFTGFHVMTLIAPLELGDDDDFEDDFEDDIPTESNEDWICQTCNSKNPKSINNCITCENMEKSKAKTVESETIESEKSETKTDYEQSKEDLLKELLG